MFPRLTFAASLLFVTAACAFTAASTPARSPRTISSGRSIKQKISFSGKVQTKNGTPLAGARIGLTAVGHLNNPQPAQLSAITAPDGTFHMYLPWSGDYVWGVSLGDLWCPGQAQPPYSQRGTTLSFAQGEAKAGVIFEINQGGVLQGSLHDQAGKAVATGDVSLMRRVQVGEKTYRWFVVDSRPIDKKGQYGFCNVPEGSYFITSQGTLRVLGDKVNTEPLAKDYVQTFYPNVLAEEAAQPVRITSGGVKKLDLVLRAAPTHHVRGHVAFPSGKSLLQPFVVLSPRNSTYIGYHAPINRAGDYDLAGIPAGKYKLVAIADSGERDLRKIPVQAEIKKEWSAAAQIDVKDSDVTAADLTLARSGRVSGQFWNTRGEKFSGGNLFLSLVTENDQYPTHVLEDGRELPLNAAEISADGHFVLHELPPGKYRIGSAGQMWIKRPPRAEVATYLASATIAGRDALRDGFEMKPGQEISDAAVVLATGTGTIKAKVRDDTGRPRSRATVLLLPVDDMKLQWQRYQSTCSYPTGDVFFNLIPPGDYKIFAMEAPPVTHYIQSWNCGTPERPRWEDLKIYEKYSTPVHVVPGTANELNLRLIRAR